MALETKSTAEEQLASGTLYTVNHTSPSIAAAGNYLVGFITGARPVVYMNRQYTATMNEALVELFEITYSAGTPIPAGNRNFVIGGAGPVSYVAAPTATPAGTPVATVKLLGGTTGGTSTIQLFSDSEFYILKPNTRYVLRLTNQDSNAGMITLRWTYRDLELVG